MKKSLLIKTTFVENHLLSRINQSGRLVYLCLFILFTSLLQANNITQGTTLYLTTGVWDDSGTARFAAYFYTGTSTGTFVNMTLIDNSTDTYEATSPSETYTNVIFCRMDGSTTTNSWANVWNQTQDLTYDGSNNLYIISGWGTTKSLVRKGR